MKKKNVVLLVVLCVVIVVVSYRKPATTHAHTRQEIIDLYPGISFAPYALCAEAKKLYKESKRTGIPLTIHDINRALGKPDKLCVNGKKG